VKLTSRPAWFEPPPQSEAELLDRARRLGGQTLGRLAERARSTFGLHGRHTKGIAGQLVERELGSQAGSAAAPDFAALGIELKTIPLGPRGRPCESTFVATLSSAEPGALHWATSPVRAKLKRVLWIPVEGASAIPWADRRLGAPILWSPTPAQEAELRDDFELLAELVAEGFREQVSARLGRVLQLRPKGRDGRDLRWTVDRDGAPAREPGRAFYLRTAFTATILSGA
jgi:DNA mismatch repair protein MutH